VCDPDQLIQKLSPVARCQRLLVTHGMLDPMIPVVLLRRQIERLKSAGLQIEWHEFVKPHTIAGETELIVIRDFIKAGYES